MFYENYLYCRCTLKMGLFVCIMPTCKENALLCRSTAHVHHRVEQVGAALAPLQSTKGLHVKRDWVTRLHF
jgi:hypothetical protein